MTLITIPTPGGDVQVNPDKIRCVFRLDDGSTAKIYFDEGNSLPCSISPMAVIALIVGAVSPRTRRLNGTNVAFHSDLQAVRGDDPARSCTVAGRRARASYRSG